MTRAALVSNTASESAAEAVRVRKTYCRAEPRSSSERASNLAQDPTPAASRDHPSRRRNIALSRAWRQALAPAAGLRHLFQESVAENSSRPAVQVATVPAGSPVVNTGVGRLSALRTPLLWPTSLSGQPLVPA